MEKESKKMQEISQTFKELAKVTDELSDLLLEENYSKEDEKKLEELQEIMRLNMSKLIQRFKELEED